MAGLDPAIQVVSSRELTRRTSAVFVESRRLDGRVKPGHDEGERFRSIPSRSKAVLANGLWRLLDFKFVSRLAPPRKP
jgi:hypothetical protein